MFYIFINLMINMIFIKKNGKNIIKNHYPEKYKKLNIQNIKKKKFNSITRYHKMINYVYYT